jgi:hypothetical protein
LQKSIIQLRDRVRIKVLRLMQLNRRRAAMVTESKDRRINTDAKIENDGVKRQPHERDEAPDGQDQKPRGVMKQAAADLAQGLVDTDLHGTPGVEKAVEPVAGTSGQAKPQPDRSKDMRDHDSVIPTRGKNQ